MAREGVVDQHGGGADREHGQRERDVEGGRPRAPGAARPPRTSCSSPAGKLAGAQHAERTAQLRQRLAARVLHGDQRPARTLGIEREQLLRARRLQCHLADGVADAVARLVCHPLALAGDGDLLADRALLLEPAGECAQPLGLLAVAPYAGAGEPGQEQQEREEEVIAAARERLHERERRHAPGERGGGAARRRVGAERVGRDDDQEDRGIGPRPPRPVRRGVHQRDQHRGDRERGQREQAAGGKGERGRGGEQRGARAEAGGRHLELRDGEHGARHEPVDHECPVADARVRAAHRVNVPRARRPVIRPGEEGHPSQV